MMADLIDRAALVAEFKRLTLGENSLIERVFADGVYAVIETRPAVDAVEVVRCKDCKHRKLRHHRGGEIWYQCANEAAGMASGVELKDNDFCSYGERREDDG